VLEPVTLLKGGFRKPIAKGRASGESSRGARVPGDLVSGQIHRWMDRSPGAWLNWTGGGPPAHFKGPAPGAFAVGVRLSQTRGGEPKGARLSATAEDLANDACGVVSEPLRNLGEGGLKMTRVGMRK